MIHVVHQHIDSFLLRFVARPDPTIYLMTLQAVVIGLGTDVDDILDMSIRKPKATFAKLVKDTVLAVLVTITIVPLPSPPM